MNKLNRLAINDEGFIFDPETGNSYTVNEVGLFILKQLKEGKGESEILDALVENYEVEREEAEKDLIDFLEQLRLMGILEAKNV
ncbi:PqqD family protein, HPr-rel-A system [Desulfurobacterium pacificum]|uniref:PqqD family protein, HPr-rel-A system n=1 Tax=Desulfurobacterium pacificum TaxID=240166 RepID=A0ABY1NCA2_9BACT|nr:HPr-rel-A system PqqD family peptide chaperone [Desulfurobacterium pacificum]SMP04266.1 PqqD family protein, HPr-rel-A system [Desulfurobacterium pacificum]